LAASIAFFLHFDKGDRACVSQQSVKRRRSTAQAENAPTSLYQGV
jgi:hypothetical protein